MSNIGGAWPSSWLSAKEYEQTAKPCLLFSCTFYDGTEAFFCSVDDGTGGVTYNGQSYVALVKNQRIGQLQANSQLGIDIFGSLSLELADAAGGYYIWESAHGFQGATLVATFVLFDVASGTFSTDSTQVFEGMCDPAQRHGETLTITAVSTYSLAKSILPPMPIQQTCPFWFPSNYAQRWDGATNWFSQYFQCGYSPDITNVGVQPQGNLGPGGQPYTSCAYTKNDCVARGMYTTDGSGRTTGRFGGVQWTPPATWIGKSYTQGKTLQGVNNVNVAKWTQYVPLTFGNTWVNAVNANVVGDPNLTEGEMLLGYGWYDQADAGGWTGLMPLVLANGLLVPNIGNTTDYTFCWNGWNDGWRQGTPFNGAIYNGDGDPYGSVLRIIVAVYNSVQASNSNMAVRALVMGRPIPVYTAPSQWTFQRTDLTAWVVYELLRLVRPDLYAKVDVQSVIEYSWVCNTAIPYAKADGSVGNHRQFGVSLSIEKPQSAAQILEGLKIAGKLMLVPDSTGNVIRFQAKQSLADQQSTPQPGSNDNSGYASYRASDNPQGSPSGTGYVAYSFDDSNVIYKSVELLQDSVSATPTIFTAQIQDEDNLWTPDTVTLANIPAYNRIRQKNSASISGIGFPNADQAYRCLNTKFAETCMGNPRNVSAALFSSPDTGGSQRWRFQTTFRGASITVGKIIRFSNTQLHIAPIFLRVEAISPSLDFGTVTITGRWHDDRWYCWAYGQQSNVAGSGQQGQGGEFAQGTVTYYPGSQLVSWNCNNTGSDSIQVNISWPNRYTGQMNQELIGQGTSGSTNIGYIVSQLNGEQAAISLIDATTGLLLSSTSAP